jgi:hypothetical protein
MALPRIIASELRPRAIARYGLILLAGICAGGRAVGAVGNWRLWHELAVSDPSAADLYRTNFWIDLVAVAVFIAAAWLVNLMLRPPPPGD